MRVGGICGALTNFRWSLERAKLPRIQAEALASAHFSGLQAEVRVDVRIANSGVLLFTGASLSVQMPTLQVELHAHERGTAGFASTASETSSEGGEVLAHKRIAVLGKLKSVNVGTLKQVMHVPDSQRIVQTVLAKAVSDALVTSVQQVPPERLEALARRVRAIVQPNPT